MTVQQSFGGNLFRLGLYRALLVSAPLVLCSCSGLANILRPSAPPSLLLGPRAQDEKAAVEERARLADSSWLTAPTISKLPAPKLVITNEVKREMRRLLKRDGQYVRNALSRRDNHYSTMVRIFNDEGIPVELINLAMIESGYKTDAKSRVGAVGMWQFMKSTGRLYGLKITAKEDQRRDPILSTIAAARHLRDLYAAYKDWHLALAAYNAGPGCIDRCLTKSKTTEYWGLMRSGKLNSQTSIFVPRFIAAAIIVQKLENYTLSELAANMEEILERDSSRAIRRVENRSGTGPTSAS